MCYFSPNFILLLLLIQAFLANCCIEHERDALLEFKAGVNDKSSRPASWRGEKCCNWAGIRCNNRTSRVVKLNLRNPNMEPIYDEGTFYYWKYHPGLTGKISPSLLFLSDLKHLDLSFNNFSGNKFPEFISTFRNLKYLNLSNTGLSGMIHPQLGNLSKLLYFDLGQDYYFSDFILSADTWWLSNMRSLKYIDMSGVDFKDSNNWVQSLNKLSSLEVLVLSDNNLNQIPNTLTLVNFTSLRVLHLSDQDFNTTIPNWMGSLHSLNVLILKGCNLVGPYPAILGNLTNLVQLDLSSDYNLNGTIPTDIGNSLKGTIPIDIVNLTNLVRLDLSGNNLNGTIPTDIGNLTNLVQLDLSFSNLNGKIPTNIGNLTNLVWLDLSGNNLTGLLSETHLTGLSKLKHLGLAHTNITILFGSEWTPSFQLNEIRLGSNKLGPKFPSWIRRQVQIENLDLTDTGIDDCIPDWVWSLSSLRYLSLSTNILRGKLPASLVHMTKLEYMDLSNNQLVGKIPFLPTSLWYLDLSNNSLSGELRKHFKSPYKNKLIVSNNHTAEVVELFPCGLTSLGFLDLSSNSLSGHLPPCWSNISALVKLANNRLSGLVPRSSSCSVELGVVSLENNSLTGEFPFDLQFCKRLQLLDLGENNFHGIIPDWVGESFSHMAFLILRSNLFSGNIPSRLTQLNNLQVLDLANNNLSGHLPRGLDNFTCMTEQLSCSSLGGIYFGESLIAMTKGLKLEFDQGGLLLWKSIDLSNNNIIGEIPREIVVLTGLLNLNLSNNHLIGNIPLEIGNLISLESLDFHMNNLSGTIPQSMSALYSLEKLNFSYNNLSGSIPTGYQLQALDDSSIYSGNPYLCGPPLEMSCRSSGRFPHNNGNDSNSKNTGDRYKWLYLFIEFGFVAGFLVVFFILLFKVKWRYTYFQMVDTVFDRLYVLMLKPKLKWASAH
ncbi:receptor-like protein EIX2 [Carex rostrata]